MVEGSIKRQYENIWDYYMSCREAMGRLQFKLVAFPYPKNHHIFIEFMCVLMHTSEG